MSKNILKQIADLFSSVEDNKVDTKTKDGKILRFSELKEGESIVQLDEDGEAELEDGTFEFEDGKKVTVKDNKIVSFEAKPSAYLELPVGEHILGDTRYIVEEEVEDEGTENEYRRNVIVEMVPVGEQTTEVDEDMEEQNSDEDNSDETEIDEKFIDVETENGVKIQIVTQTEGVVSEGDEVFIVPEEGDMEVAPAGEHVLTDGRTIVVDDEGKISEVKDAPESEEENKQESADETEVFEVVQTKLTNILDKFKSLETKFEEIENENKELKDKVAKFSGEPSDNPTSTKIEFNKKDKQSRLDFFSKR